MIGHSAQITDNTEQLLGEILTELAERLSQGQPIDLTSYEAEYPQHAEKIRELLPTVESIVHLGLSGDASTGLRTGGQGVGGKTGDVNEPLGDFRLLGEIGRGGMGVVYEAEQISIGRSVALKVLPFAAVLDHKAITRFKNEARAAGSLTHPNIVPVYGVGNERGVYYYAMALVHGLTLAEVIQDLKTHVLSSKGHDTQRFSLVEIVEQHSSDGDGLSVKSGQFDPTVDTGEMQESAQVDEPTVKEFHAAISTHRSKFGRDYQRQITRIGVQAADALHYAHENGIVHRDIKPGNLMVDTDGKLWITDFGLARIESDIGMTRSGDLLGTLRYMAPEQALGKRIIVDHRADIYSLGATLYELLALRSVFDGADRETLLKQLTFEEPAPLRRYCSNVPADLETIVMKAIAKNPDERYASAGDMAEDLRALEANRPIKAKPATLWVRGKKWVGRNQGLVTATVVILAVATIGLGISNLLITQQRDAAQQAKEQESVQRAEAERQRQIAQENFQRARDAVDEYLTRVSQEELLNAPGMQLLRQDLLELALKYYQEFATERADDPELQADLAQAFHSVGNVSDQLGDTNQALEAYKKALEIRRKLTEADPEVLEYRDALAWSLNNLANLLSGTGKMDEAIAAYREAIEIRQNLVKENADVLEYRSGLAATLNNLASLQNQSFKLSGARATFQQAIDIQQQLAEENPEVLEYRDQLARILTNFAGRLKKLRKWEESMDAYMRAIEIRRQLVQENPDVLEYKKGLAVTLHNRANQLSDSGKLDEGLAGYRHAIDIQRKLAEENPEVLEYRYGLAASFSKLGRRIGETGERDKALEAYQQSIEILKKLVEQNPEVLQYRSWLASSLAKGAILVDNPGKREEAIADFRQAIELRKKLVQEQPDDFGCRINLARCIGRFAAWQRQTGSRDEALAATIQANENWQKFAEEQPEALVLQAGLAVSWSDLANLRKNTGNLERAMAAHQQAIEIMQKLVVENAENASYRLFLIHSLNGLGVTLSDAGKDDKANRTFQEAIEISLKKPEGDRDVADWGYLGQSYFHAERWEEARHAFEKGIELGEETTPTLQQGPRWPHLSIALAQIGEKEKAREYYLVLKKQFDDEAPAFDQHKDDLAELAKLLGIEPERDQPPENDESDDDATGEVSEVDKNETGLK